MLWRVGVATLLVLAIGGQLDGLVPAGGSRPLAVLADRQHLPGEPAKWTDLPWPEDGRLDCPGACRLEVPEADGELWVAWNGTQVAGVVAALDGVAGIPAFDAVLVGEVDGGEQLKVWGAGELQLAILAGVEDVPNLVALVPTSLGRPLPGQADAGACLPEETALGLARCLRFTSGVANLGDAPLALRSGRTGEAAMVQELPGGDRDAGVASYHASHGHFHYARFIAFDVHAVDEGTRLRGERVLASAKTGFCMVDYGEVQREDPLVPKSYWRDGCEPYQRSLEMGVNPGWYDIYRWFLPEQAVDPTTLAPGTYELVATLDPDGTLVESHTLDNKASLRFVWDGRSAVPLDGHGLYGLVPQPS